MDENYTFFIYNAIKCAILCTCVVLEHPNIVANSLYTLLCTTIDKIIIY
jgi:hypothetical protein